MKMAKSGYQQGRPQRNNPLRQKDRPKAVSVPLEMARAAQLQAITQRPSGEQT
jgi:hypothetical protein